MSLALWPAEQLLNQLLQSDQHMARQLLPFAGKNIELRSHRPGINMVIRIEKDAIRLSGVDAATLGVTPDASIEGEASELLKLLLANESSRALANRQLTISGDTEFFQEFYQRLHALDLRWDDLLAPLLGDVVTEQASQMQQQASDLAKDTGVRLKRNVEDFLKEEARLVPHEYALEQFQQELDALKFQIDRAEARTKRLEARLSQPDPQVSN